MGAEEVLPLVGVESILILVLVAMVLGKEIVLLLL